MHSTMQLSLIWLLARAGNGEERDLNCFLSTMNEVLDVAHFELLSKNCGTLVCYARLRTGSPRPRDRRLRGQIRAASDLPPETSRTLM